MQAVLCPVCGRSNSEFDANCAACGSVLPLPSIADVTLEEGPPGELQPRRREADPLVGQQISHFRILRLLGRGGMGIVYQAVDLELGREVALKFLSQAARSPRDEARFRREARATAALDHPNIGTIYEIGEFEGRRFIAMAYYDGETLAARLTREAEGRLPIADAAAIAGQLASALAAAHDTGVVHRDLKPDNVMLTRGRVKLLDFGLAKWAEAPSVTERGVVVGTAAYMAPEQLRGGESGSAGDLWALGVVLYQMLTGQRPFGGERRGMMHAILFEDPPPLRELRPDVPEALERIALRCLAKDPAERYPDAHAILAELAATGLWETGSTSTTAAAAPRRQAWRKWAWAASAVLLLAAGTAAFLFLRRPKPPVYVAVLKPEVSGSLLADDSTQVRVNLQAAMLRTMAALDGLAALDSAQVNAVKGAPAEVARAVAAGEVIASHADCAGDLCQVSLRRLDGADGHVLWTGALRLPSSDPRLFANAVAASLRQAYAERKLRVPRLELEIAGPDYKTFLELRLRLADPAAIQDVLSRLGELRQRAPSFLDVYVLEAKVARKLYVDTGEDRYLQRGLAVAQQALTLAPDDPQPLDTLFSLNLESGRFDEAEAVLERMEEIDPAGSLLRRGQLAERRGQPEEALKLMAEAVRLQPSWQSLLTVAIAEYRQSRFDDARRHLEQLLQRSPGNLEGLQTLAQIELLRDPDRAVALLREAARHDPGPKSLTNLGVALLLLRRYNEAERSLRLALAQQPDDPSASLNLADCLTLAGRGEEARRLYTSIAASAERLATPGNWQLLSVKAQALAHLGKTVEAVEAIQQALRLTPDNAQLAYEAAVVYILLGDRGSALFHVRQAASRGVDANWFALPFFDPLRGEPAFQALSLSRRSGP
ncbi:MAG TPA: protein kinase [Thermoanaerobaculia bacterium]|jgi:serine/threonine-protein kinase|nr:protein kinase [Thermoanaerobaculia bacterium]